MTEQLDVVCLREAEPHRQSTDCERPYPAWLWVEGRTTCTHAGYQIPHYPGVLACRCLICARCGQHTGNSTQGHYWSLCQVTKTTRGAHFCCPDNCQLEATE